MISIEIFIVLFINEQLQRCHQLIVGYLQRGIQLTRLIYGIFDEGWICESCFHFWLFFCFL